MSKPFAMSKIIGTFRRLANFNDPLKMVIAVRTDLKMGKGKIAAQVGHGVLTVGFQAAAADMPLMEEYFIGQQKVCVKVASEEELMELERQAKAAGIYAVVITDAGCTQIPAGSKTVCAMGPARISEIDKITGKLKLL